MPYETTYERARRLLSKFTWQPGPQLDALRDAGLLAPDPPRPTVERLIHEALPARWLSVGERRYVADRLAEHGYLTDDAPREAR
jgi:hypothetical protein